MGKDYSYTTISFAGVIKDSLGKRYWEASHPLYMHTELSKFQLGQEVSCVYTSKKPMRTESQNRYYWGVYLPMISAETGNDIDDLHILFKGMFLQKAIVEVLGHKVRRVQSTTELTAGQFSEYIQRIEELTGVLAPPTENFALNGSDKKEEVKEIEYPEYEGKTSFD